MRVENPHRDYKFWYKTQIHCHSQESNGKRGQPPRVVEEAYRDMGYDCVFLTDHNKVTASPEVQRILHIDGAEDGKSGRHHFVALGVNWPAVHQYHDDHPENEGGIANKNESGIEGSESCPCQNIYQRLTYITEIQDAVAVVAHPNACHC